MNKKTIENTLKFMERVELKWSEVFAFIECINALTEEFRKEEPSK